jgi:TFIIF-interacting CTD phosphatase-like protein
MVKKDNKPLYKPFKAPASSKYKKMVYVMKDNKKRKIGFGLKGYKHNYSAKARKAYLARSAGIRDKSGKLTKNNKNSANYWARRVLWNA